MITTSADREPTVAATRPGWLGAPPCRDLVIGVTAGFALRAVAAQVDPLASALEQRVNLVLAAAMFFALVACAAYASTGRSLARAPVAPDGVPTWARPGGSFTALIAVCAALMSVLSVVGLLDTSSTLVDHVSSAATAVYLGLGLRVQWAAATGRMPTAVPVVIPSGHTRLLVRVTFAAIALAVATTVATAPAIVSRDQEIARCAGNDRVHSEAQDAIGQLRGEALQRRIEALARELAPCG